MPDCHPVRVPRRRLPLDVAVDRPAPERMRPKDGAALSLLLDHVPGRAGETVADP